MVEEQPTWSGTARVVRGGHVLAEVSRGSAVGHEPCGPHTRFQAGSISKQLLSLVVLAAVRRRELHLHRPIGRLLEWIPPAWGSITLHQLLSHTSGLGHWGDLPALPASFAVAPPPRADLLAMTVAAPLVSSPGTAWRYSGPGFLVAAAVVEAATGADYGAAAATLFAAAGMSSTTSGQFPVGRPGVAVGHHEGRPVPVPAGFTDLPGTGDLWTTTTDLSLYSQSLRSGALADLCDAGRLWAPHCSVDQPQDGSYAWAQAYGYGTFLGRLGREAAWFVPGDNPGYQSLLAHVPGRDVTVVVLANDDAPAVDQALRSLDVVRE